MKPIRVCLLITAFTLSACSIFGGSEPPPPTEPPVDTAATEAAIAAQIDAAVQATAAAQAAIDAEAAQIATAEAEAAAQAEEPTPEPAPQGNFIVGGNYTQPGECPASTFLSVSADPANGAYPAPVLNVSCDDTTVTVTANGIPNFEFVPTTASDLQAGDYTYNFPLNPVLAETTTPLPLLDAVAVAVNGLPIFGPNEAENSDYGDPFLDDILDFCNGHTGGGRYHLHAAPSCIFTDLNNSPGLVVGWSFDGFPIVAPVVCNDDTCTTSRTVDSTWELTNPDVRPAWDKHSVVPDKSELDECNGMVLDNGNYVYFATPSFPYFLGCYRGIPTENRSQNGNGTNVGAGGNGGNANNGGQQPDFAAAAGALGVSEEDFRNAVGRPPFDLDALVGIFNVDRDTLINALLIGGFPLPADIGGGGGGAIACDGPNFAAAAAVLGVTENALRTAMAVTPLDLTVAANTLGITQDALIAASIANCLPLPAGIGTNLIPQGAGGLIPQIGGGDN